MILKIDNSKRSTAVTCMQKYFLRYIKNLTTIHGSTALRYGSTWHALMEGYYSSIRDNGWESHQDDHIQNAISLATKVWNEITPKADFYDDYRTLENCFQSFVEYLEVFQADLFMMNVIESERIFDIQMHLTDEEKRRYLYLVDQELHFTGKLDLEVELSGQHWIMEFKTTGQPAQTQAKRLQRSAQILGYTWAGKKIGNDIAGSLVAIHQLTSRKVKDGGYGKTTREFVRQPNIFSNADLDTWRQSYLSTCNRIAEAELFQNFPQEFDSCYQFGECQFCKLCEQNRPFEELNTTGFKVEKWDVLESSTGDAPIIEIEA